MKLQRASTKRSIGLSDADARLHGDITRGKDLDKATEKQVPGTRGFYEAPRIRGRVRLG